MDMDGKSMVNLLLLKRFEAELDSKLVDSMTT